jgi:Cu(I)/Ag(I) efflux system membrane fusion protein
VPSEAVYRTGGLDYVFTASNKNVFTPRQVTLGKRVGDFFEVISGVKNGDQIAAGPNFLLDAEARVRAYGPHSH